jgi:DoxX-like family
MSTHSTAALSAANAPVSISVSHRWIGRTLTALPVLFLLFDSALKLANAAPGLETMPQLGYAPEIARSIGLLELFCVLLYLTPRLQVLGAVVLTGYLGGAVATHVRVGNPLFSHVLFPVYIAALL